MASFNQPLLGLCLIYHHDFLQFKFPFQAGSNDYNTWCKILEIMGEFKKRFHWSCMVWHSAGVSHRVAPQCVTTGRTALDNVFYTFNDVHAVLNLLKAIFSIEMYCI